MEGEEMMQEALLTSEDEELIEVINQNNEYMNGPGHAQNASAPPHFTQSEIIRQELPDDALTYSVN